MGVCFPVIGGGLVALRFFMRHRKKVDLQSGVKEKVKLGADDWLCLAAFVSDHQVRKSM